MGENILINDVIDFMNEDLIEIEFRNKFNGDTFINYMGDYIYGIKLHPEDENNFDYQEYLLYPLNGHDVKKLMEESLKVGKDLVLQECKNRPYDENEAEDKEYIEKVLKREKELKYLN